MRRGAPRLEDRTPLELIRSLQGEDAAALRAVRRAERPLARLADRVSGVLKRGGRLVYVGAGTSGRLGMLDAVELPPTFGISPSRVRTLVAGGRAALEHAVEGAEDNRAAAVAALRRLRVGPGDLVLGISASGTTPYVLAALVEARRRKAGSALLCCQRPRGLRLDQLIHLDTGPELIPGSTRLKAGTATKLALNALSTVALVRAGHVYRGQMVDLRPTNRKLRQRAVELVRALASVSPARARALLRQSGERPRLALAMAFTGLPAAPAARALRARGLAALEKC